MNTLLKRLLIFFIGIPAVVALVMFLPFQRHLSLNIAVVIFSSIGAVEFSQMLEKKNMRVSKIEGFILGALAPAALTLNICFNLPEWIIPLFIIAASCWALLSQAFSRLEKMEAVTNHLAACLSILIYPGFFLYWIVKMTAWENPGAILLFLFISFGSDSTAWLFGNLFGANNRGIIAASPNKSIAGFIGGMAGSIIISGGAALLFPSVFITHGEYASTPGLVAMAVLLGFFTGIAAALGDLAESAVKRSCGVKDSGNLMPGRGGILDSIDSIAVASPVFYLLFYVLFINI
jgi:phosphatidate cytidylyltransferase